jgi:CheY-like chemotaxis protein
MLRKVLISDDDVDSADALALLLQLEGHEVTAAYSASETLSLIEDLRPEAAVLDISMSGMDGYEIARRVRARHGSSILLIAVTGWSKPDDIDRSQAAGFDHHCSKPVDLEKVRSLLTGKL